MSENKKFHLPVTTIALFLAAACLLVFSTVGGTRAALNYVSEYYDSQVSMHDIGISLVENGERVAWRDYIHDETHTIADGTWDELNYGILLDNMLTEGEEVVLGKSYPEALAVKNSGTIDEYVRLIVYRYWLDADGKKNQSLSPCLIDLHTLEGSNNWIMDEEATTEERLVFYYTKPVASGETTLPVSDLLTIHDGVSAKVTQTTSKNEDGFTVITTSYDYDGYSFHLEAECHGVQTHNAVDAIKSAWGIDAEISGDGTLSKK